MRPLKMPVEAKSDAICFKMGANELVYRKLSIENIEVAQYANMLHNRQRFKLGVFNPNYFDPITVSYRDGHYYVVDGLRRMALAQKEGIKTVVAKVLNGLTYEGEATYYAEQHDRQLGLYPYEKYLLLLEAKDPVALRLKAITEMLNISVFNGDNKKNRGEDPYPVLYAVSQCMSILRKGSDFDLMNILQTIQEAGWNTENNAYSQYIIMGLYSTFKAYQYNIPTALQVAKEQMKGKTPNSFIRICRDYVADYNTNKVEYGNIASISRYLSVKIDEKIEK